MTSRDPTSPWAPPRGTDAGSGPWDLRGGAVRGDDPTAEEGVKSRNHVGEEKHAGQEEEKDKG